MAFELSSDCECPNCTGDAESESDWNLYSKIKENGSFYSKSKKSPLPPLGVQSCPAQCSFTKQESDKEYSAFLPSKKEDSRGYWQNNYLRLSPEGIQRKIKLSRELTIQDLLREFGVSGKFQPNSMSVGHFRDHVVMKFRRALYYSGIWVSHVQGNRYGKHFSAKYFQNNPGSLHRLVPWLKRELRAVYGDYGYTVKNILSAILHHMTKYDLDSESFIHLLEPYLLQHTHHFLHEFISFVHSPYNMQTYDQRAIYECPSVSTWATKTSVAFGPILPLCKDHNLTMSQHDQKQSKDNRVQWNEEVHSESHLKQFPNGNSSVKNLEVPPIHLKAASKVPNWTHARPESGNHQGTISPENMPLRWAIQRESGARMLNCKNHGQERNSEEIKLHPSHIQELKKTKAVTHTISTPEISNQDKLQRYNLRKGRGLRIGPQTNFQKKQIENLEHLDSSPKVFQRLSRERSSVNCQPRKRDPSCSCMSENAFSPKKNGRQLSSFRKKMSKCSPSFLFIEGGSHHSRRIQRRGKSSTQRSECWCGDNRRRPEGQDPSNPSLEISHRGGLFTQNIVGGSPKEKHVHSHESNYRRASLTPAQYLKLSSTAEMRSTCPWQGGGASQIASPCNSPSCLRIVKQRSPSKGKMKQKAMFSETKRTKGVSQKRNKSQHSRI